MRVVAVLLGNERQPVAHEAHADGRLLDDSGQPVDPEFERVAEVHDGGRHRCGRAGERERRQLLDAVFPVVDFECRFVDGGDAHLADVGLHGQRLADERVALVVAEIGEGGPRNTEEQQGRNRGSRAAPAV